MFNENLKKIDAILDEMVDSGFAAGANCMILKDGKEAYYGEAGFADIDGKKPIKADSIFRLYSMSKPITSAAAMLLIEDGLLDINRPVGDFIESFKNQMVCINGEKSLPKRPMKVKDLLNMTSGLTYCGENSEAEIAAAKLCDEAISKLGSENEITTLEFAKRLGEAPLTFSPGTSFQYSFSADVLGAVIEVVSGMKLGEFMRKRIFEPLGMPDTGFYVKEESRDRLVKLYKETPDGLEEYNYNHLNINLKMDHEPGFESGGAGLCSTIKDYSKFATMLLNGGGYEGKRIMLPGTVKFMTAGSMEAGPKEAFSNWDGLEGFNYSNLLRVCVDPGKAVTLSSPGEYGWDGWTGPYFANDPVNKITILQMTQKTDLGTSSYVRRIRNVVFSAVE